MSSIKHFLLFTKKYLIQIQRKWISLPFLLLLPVILAGLIILLILTFFIQEDQTALQVGLVDKDQSDETILLTSLLEESSQIGAFLELHVMSESSAINKIESDELSGYIIFSEDFTADLYSGNSVELPIIGNPKKQLESYMLSQFVNSIITQIRDAQANILTLNHYAKEINMDTEERNDFIFEQFKDFVFFTLGRETIIHDREAVNKATSSPLHYYGVSGWFILSTVWCVIIYLFLTKEETPLMKRRIKLYGVTDLQQISAKIFVVFIFSFVLSSSLFLLLYHLLNLDLAAENIVRISVIISLYFLCLNIVLAIIETVVLQEKLSILLQTLLVGTILLLSGALIPVIYFPLWLEELIIYLFSYEAFNWVTEIILNERYFVDYIPISVIGAALSLILIALSLVREYVTE